jgi:type I restriction enzyme R subunit
MSDKSPIPFRGFDERGDVRIYHHGILPHWRQDNCTYFVTFRQDDALPTSVVREFEYERQQWLKHRGIDANDPKWKIAFSRLSTEEQRIYERLVGTKLNEHLDVGYGSCVLRRENLATIVANAINYFHGQRVLTGDFVVMPNHVHALMRPLPGFELEDILHSIKSFAANEINRVLGANGKFWQRQSYDHIVREYDQLEAYQQYIGANPEKAKLSEGEYIYASASYVPDE